MVEGEHLVGAERDRGSQVDRVESPDLRWPDPACAVQDSPIKGVARDPRARELEISVGIVDLGAAQSPGDLDPGQLGGDDDLARSLPLRDDVADAVGLRLGEDPLQQSAGADVQHDSLPVFAVQQVEGRLVTAEPQRWRRVLEGAGRRDETLADGDLQRGPARAQTELLRDGLPDQRLLRLTQACRLVTQGLREIIRQSKVGGHLPRGTNALTEGYRLEPDVRGWCGRAARGRDDHQAAGVGFEPTRGLPLVAFKATALGRYANPPGPASRGPKLTVPARRGDAQRVGSRTDTTRVTSAPGSTRVM